MPLRARWLLALCALPSALLGQAPARALQVGDRVRLTAQADTGIYVVRAMSPETLTVQLPRSTALASFPLTSLSRLEVSRGSDELGHRVMRRGLKGAIGGIVVGAALGYASGDDPEGTFLRMTRAGKAGVGAAFLGTAGAMVGCISALFGRGERWQPVPLPNRLGATMRGDGVLTLSYSF